ncbi:hypothetical protein AX17_002598 [Amanita inopinata Kibby_2008]|nr:hypothetical protein AX17_002598 [Amanita inopinata Kibby_2008]
MALPERPEPMNVVTHHSKVKVSITLPDPTFVTGRYMSGKMEMECRADKGLGIGVVMIELFGIQELSSRDHSATSTFLHAQRLFQGSGLPPSNAVQAHAEPGDPPLPAHHYHARRGISTFLFRIPLPLKTPSSANFGGGLATVKYELRASASVYWRGDKKLVTERKSVDVVEGLDDVLLEDYANGNQATSIAVGEHGKVWMQGSIVGGGIVTAGESACVELQVKNHSPKKNTGLTLTLTRNLILPGATSNEKQPLQISDTLTNVPFRGPEYIIHPGVEGVANLVFDIPKNARGMKGGVYEDEGDDRPRETQSIFEIQCIVSVKMSMGIGSKDLVLEIPVTIVHPLALPDEPIPLPQEQVPYAAPAEAFHFSVAPPHTDPHAYAPYPFPIDSPPPPAMSPGQPFYPAYIDQNRVWPPPPPSQSPFSYQYVSPLDQPQPHTTSPPLITQPPPRPASALANSHPYTFYLEQAISGLPATTIQHPLLPLNLTNHYNAASPRQTNFDNLEPQEGKGERASRIAHHLRMSSRHRSVSPCGHRFPLPRSLPADPSTSEELQFHVRTLPPPSLLPPIQDVSVELSEPPIDISNELAASPPLHSPRPIPSPKMSHVSLPRSERVEELERMAAEADDGYIEEKTPQNSRKSSKRKAKRRDYANYGADFNKTLPAPPVPTRKGYLAPPNVVDSSDTKVEHEVSRNEGPTPLIPLPADKAPPTPTLTAVTPVRHVKSNLAEKLAENKLESGLDALERRLLAEVGTQKVERASAPANAHARGIFGASINVRGEDAGAALTAEDDSQPVRGHLSPIKIPSGSIDDEGFNLDSAISSLTLADGGWAMEVDRRAKNAEKEREAEQERVRLGDPGTRELADHDHDRDSDEKTHRAGTVGGKSKSKSSFSGDDGREEYIRRGKQRCHVADVVAGDTEQEDGGVARGKNKEGSSKENKGGKKKEGHHKSRKAVKSRVAAWLGTIEPDALLPEDDMAGASHSDPLADLQQPPVEEDFAHTPTSRVQKAKADVAAEHADGPLPVKDLPDSKDVRTDVPTSAPNPRSSGFMPIGTQKKDAKRVASNIYGENGKGRMIHGYMSNVSPPVLSTKPVTTQRMLNLPRDPDANVRASDADPSSKDIGAGSGVQPKAMPAHAALEVPFDLADRHKNREVQPALRLPAPNRQTQDPEVKYDVRSARGGRGGKVTAVAAFWASAAAKVKEVSKASTSKPPGTKPPPTNASSAKQAAPPEVPRLAKPIATQALNRPFVAQQQQRTASQPQSMPAPAKPPRYVGKGAQLPATTESPPKLLDLAGKSKPVTKSTSVPAVVSSSLATPMLSSTASLARPANTPASRQRLATPDPISANRIPQTEAARPHAPSKAKSTPDLAFGKARLRDLIKKYQDHGS